jgi:hypothetical protein
VAYTELSAVKLHVPWDQLAHPTLAFIGVDIELPERMRRRVTQTISVSAVDVRSLLSGIDLLLSNWLAACGVTEDDVIAMSVAPAEAAGSYR